jgi:NTE family protein
MAGPHTPEVLVLGGGGILGEAWMTALLVGLEETTGFDPRECRGYVGTSAGSIVAAVLTAGADLRERLGELPEPPAVVEETAPDEQPGVLSHLLALGMGAAGAAAAPVVAFGLRSAEPVGALARRGALSRFPTGRRRLDHLGRELDRIGARWDGRLSIAAVDAGSGRRVMFGADGAPAASVSAAVQGSCAIPGIFAPLVLDGRRYVDGGVWSPTNMDRAPITRGTRVLCLNPTGANPGPRSPFGAMARLSRGLATLEALALQRRGARVSTIGPDTVSQRAMGSNFMDPGPRGEVIAAALAQGRAIGRRRGPPAEDPSR